MSLAILKSRAQIGTDAPPVTIEVFLSGGLPSFSVVGMPETAKAQYIARVFDDAHKSPLSLIVLDDLERLLEYVRIGPRFSNVVLQTLLTCVKKVPKKSKVVVMATTSSAALVPP